MTQEQYAQLFGFAVNDEPISSDVGVFIEGDGSSRPEVMAGLHHSDLIKKLIVTGETKRNPGKLARLPAVIKKLKKLNILKENIIIEPRSISTREQAVEFVKLAKKNNWKSAIISAPLYHQPRVYATFIKAMNEAGYNLYLINHPVRGLSWFEPSSHGTRQHLIKKELVKINRYLKKGHVANFKEVASYQKWKEKTMEQSSHES